MRDGAIHQIGLIDLASPVGSIITPVHRGQLRTTFLYVCPECKKEVQVRANSFRGRTAVPGVGGMDCPYCTQEARCPGR